MGKSHFLPPTITESLTFFARNENCSFAVVDFRVWRHHAEAALEHFLLERAHRHLLDIHAKIHFRFGRADVAFRIGLDQL